MFPFESADQNPSPPAQSHHSKNSSGESSFSKLTAIPLPFATTAHRIVPQELCLPVRSMPEPGLGIFSKLIIRWLSLRHSHDFHQWLSTTLPFHAPAFSPGVLDHVVGIQGIRVAILLHGNRLAGGSRSLKGWTKNPHGSPSLFVSCPIRLLRGRSLQITQIMIQASE